jgi:hypothetical protein
VKTFDRNLKGEFSRRVFLKLMASSVLLSASCLGSTNRIHLNKRIVERVTKHYEPTLAPTAAKVDSTAAKVEPTAAKVDSTTAKVDSAEFTAWGQENIQMSSLDTAYSFLR